MKITTRQLRAIIKEEVEKAMHEMDEPGWDVSNYQSVAKRDLQGMVDTRILQSLEDGSLTEDDVVAMIEDFGDDGTYAATLDHYRRSLANE